MKKEEIYLPCVVNLMEQASSTIKDRGIGGPDDVLAIVGHVLHSRERLRNTQGPLLGLLIFISNENIYKQLNEKYKINRM